MNLNPFKKMNEKNKAEEQRRAEARVAEEERVEELVKKAAALEDPAEKVIRLRALRGMLGGMVREQRDAIATEAHEKGEKAGTLAMMPFSVAGAIAFAAITGPLAVAGMGALLGGVFIGEAVDKRRAKTVKRQLEVSTAGHIQYLSDKFVAVGNMMDATVAEHVLEISKSPLQGEIMKDMRLAKVFADAAAKRLVATEEEVAALKEAQKKAAARPDIEKDYKKLADVMKPPAEKRPPAKKSGPQQGGQ